ncbi:MAG TPA: phosphate ABC transporter substrate-binding protein PstS [Candidatus Deferrimicrobium sp.]|nr:phosphate ABC transporter substrate-binding protein PstS [Candidatus Deferrimicrobium sp.]
MRRMKRIATSVLICSLLIGIVGCRTAPGAPVKDLAVAGSTFAEPLYVKQLDAWYQKTQVKAAYGALSSSGALRALQDRTIDVGATDVLLGAEDQARLPASVLQIPTCLGAVAICVNLPGNPALRMDVALVSAMFRGDVKTWNDARIAALNPVVKLPDTPVVVLHRADGSGTTGIFTTYLAAADQTWNNKVGAGQLVAWPAGVGVTGNAGMAAMVRQTTGAIGYMEYTFAMQSSLNCIALRNRSGAFVVPSISSMQAAVPPDVTADLQGTLLNRPGTASYPIVSFTWLVFYRDQAYDGRPQERAVAIYNLVSWLLGDGQSLALPLQYCTLPETVRKAAVDLLEQLSWQGKPVK